MGLSVGDVVGLGDTVGYLVGGIDGDPVGGIVERIVGTIVSFERSPIAQLGAIVGGFGRGNGVAIVVVFLFLVAVVLEAPEERCGHVVLYHRH